MSRRTVSRPYRKIVNCPPESSKQNVLNLESFGKRIMKIELKTGRKKKKCKIQVLGYDDSHFPNIIMIIFLFYAATPIFEECVENTTPGKTCAEISVRGIRNIFSTFSAVNAVILLKKVSCSLKKHTHFSFRSASKTVNRQHGLI